MLESAQKHARSKISFRINGDVYTADLDALVQKRQAKPYTERAIRRTVATDRHIAAMVQTVESFKQEIAQREQHLVHDLSDAVATIVTHTAVKVQWERKADSGWVLYCAEITAALEKGYEVRTTNYFTHSNLAMIAVAETCTVVDSTNSVMCMVALSCAGVHCSWKACELAHSALQDEWYNLRC